MIDWRIAATSAGEIMAHLNRSADRFTLIRPVEGQALIVGQTLKMPCRLIDFSTIGSRLELLPASRTVDEVSSLLQTPDTEIISEFRNTTIGPWKMSLLIRRVSPTGEGYCIWGNYARAPVLPVLGLINISTRQETFLGLPEEDFITASPLLAAQYASNKPDLGRLSLG
ncbi:MAG: hypothetical protein H6R18_124 [Proteobacteria bacterium]|nr:hypothetical protein [Pseudomonadota bacterium]